MTPVRSHSRARLGLRPLLARLALAVGALVAAAPAAAWPNMDAKLDGAVAEFVVAQTGGDAMAEKNARTFDALLAEPGRQRDPLAMVFAGAATARLANTTWLPWKKLSHAEDGLARIDKALALLQPKDEQATAPGASSVAKTVRYVAASVMVELPSFFNRGAQASRLIQQLSTNLDADPTTTPAFKAAVHTLLGQQAARQKDKALARKHFEKAIALDTKPEADDARKELQALGA